MIYLIVVEKINNLFFNFSLAVHPNKLLIATGQATGHDRREGRVSYHIIISDLKDNCTIERCTYSIEHIFGNNALVS